MSKIKILISTDSAALTSGLANTTRNIFIPLLRKYPDKYEIHQLGFFHFNPTIPVPWPIYQTKTRVNPNGSTELDIDDKYGEKSFDEIVSSVKPDIVFGYGDLWHFAPTINSVHRNSYRLINYYTVDGQPYVGHYVDNGASTTWGQALDKSDLIISLSNFGKQTLLRSCPELKDKSIKVMYHSMQMNKYRILTPSDKEKVRHEVLGKILGDKQNFICGFVGRNQFRKQNYKLWELCHYMVHGDYIECNDCKRITTKEWDHSARKTRDISELTIYDPGYDYSYCWHCKSGNITNGIPNPKFYLWMHTPKDDPGYHIDLQRIMWNVQSNCIYTPKDNQYISDDDLIKIMQCFDIGYYPSGGEGFGNFSAELLACGIPMVYSNYSAHGEICSKGGLPVRVSYIPEIFHGIQRAVVDNNHAVEQVLKLYRNPVLRTNLGLAGANFINNFDINIMVDVWDSIFSETMNKRLPIKNRELIGGIL